MKEKKVNYMELCMQLRNDIICERSKLYSLRTPEKLFAIDTYDVSAKDFMEFNTALTDELDAHKDIVVHVYDSSSFPSDPDVAYTVFLPF